MTTLPLTGERTVPGVPGENYWFRRHEAAYLHVRKMLGGQPDGVVLEVGCGEGYGTALLCDRAAAPTRTVVGLDYDATTIAHASLRYASTPGGPAFVRGNLAALPFRDGVCDALVTLQVVEHVWDHGQFVRECARVLRPDGLLVVTTPNRLTFSPGLAAPVNPFHTHEFVAAELISLLANNGFAVDQVGGLHAGARLRELDARHGGSLVAAQLACPEREWDARLRRDVATVAATDFVVLDTTAADPDLSLDLLVRARVRPCGALR